MNNETENKPRAEAGDKPAGDFYIHGGGSLYLFCPVTPEAHAWLDEHCSSPEHHYLGRNLAVEHRYIESIVEYAINDGLTPLSR